MAAKKFTKTEQAILKGSSFRSFLDAYVEAALWSSTDDEGRPLDEYGEDALTKDAKRALAKDAADFYLMALSILVEARTRGDAYKQAGHDFWLTRNGHGAGFRGGHWSEPAESELYKLAKSFGSQDLYVNRKRIYAS